jgi:hypothetical protein
MMQYLLVFASVFLLDVAFGFYVKNVAVGSANKAGLWAMAIFVLNGAATILYVQNPWNLIPAVAGAFLGTVTAVNFGDNNAKD